jgi:hypothetical protein
MTDKVVFHECCHAVALLITVSGTTIPSVCGGDTENTTAVKQLLADLVARAPASSRCKHPALAREASLVRDADLRSVAEAHLYGLLGPLGLRTLGEADGQSEASVGVRTFSHNYRELISRASYPGQTWCWSR